MTSLLVCCHNTGLLSGRLRQCPVYPVSQRTQWNSAPSLWDPEDSILACECTRDTGAAPHCTTHNHSSALPQLRRDVLEGSW